MKHSVTKLRQNTHDAFRVRDERALAAATATITDSDAEAEAAPRRDATRLRRRYNAAGKLSATVPAQFMIFNWRCCKELINTQRYAVVSREFIRPLYCTVGIVVTGTL